MSLRTPKIKFRECASESYSPHDLTRVNLITKSGPDPLNWIWPIYFVIVSARHVTGWGDRALVIMLAV